MGITSPRNRRRTADGRRSRLRRGRRPRGGATYTSRWGRTSSFARFLRETKVPPRDAAGIHPDAVRGRALSCRSDAPLHVPDIITDPRTVINGAVRRPAALGNKGSTRTATSCCHDVARRRIVQKGGRQAGAPSARPPCGACARGTGDARPRDADRTEPSCATRASAELGDPVPESHHHRAQTSGDLRTSSRAARGRAVGRGRWPSALQGPRRDPCGRCARIAELPHAGGTTIGNPGGQPCAGPAVLLHRHRRLSLLLLLPASSLARTCGGGGGGGVGGFSSRSRKGDRVYHVREGDLPGGQNGAGTLVLYGSFSPRRRAPPRCHLPAGRR